MMKHPKDKRTLFSLSAISGALLALSVGAVQADSVTTQNTISGIDVNSLVAFNSGDNDCRPWQDCDDDDGGVIVTPPEGDDSDLPAVSSVEAAGPYTPTIDKNVGSSREGWVAYPQNIGQDGVKHPVLIWGPGGGTGPAEYDWFLNRLASHGFIVYSEVSTGNGTEMKSAMTWLQQQNDNPSSPLYQNINVSRIAAGGHSMGSITTFAMADDPRLTTTIHVAGGSFDGNGSDSLRNPTLYIGGTEDFATSNTTRDYQNTDSVPVFFTILDDTDHIAATRNGMPLITAWLRWHLAGEDERKTDFIAPDCTYCSGIYDSEYKNW
ncbi:poly(ethylene terephthalate) hydrolase family protein [Ketobacter sp.]